MYDLDVDIHARIQKNPSGGVLEVFFSHINIFHIGCTDLPREAIGPKDLLEKQLDPRGPISSRGGPYQFLLRKHLATCDFPGCSEPWLPSGSAHELALVETVFHFMF